MNISATGLKFIETVEGKEKKAYPDSGGAPTIGIGHLLTNDERKSGKIRILKNNPHQVQSIKYSSGLTDVEIYDLLRFDLIGVESMVNLSVKVPLLQNQYDTLVSFAFNVGNNAFLNSTLLKLLNKGDYKSVPQQLMRWVHDNGKKVVGLENRRLKEVKLWDGLWG